MASTHDFDSGDGPPPGTSAEDPIDDGVPPDGTYSHNSGELHLGVQSGTSIVDGQHTNCVLERDPLVDKAAKTIMKAKVIINDATLATMSATVKRPCRPAQGVQRHVVPAPKTPVTTLEIPMSKRNAPPMSSDVLVEDPTIIPPMMLSKTPRVIAVMYKHPVQLKFEREVLCM